MFSKQGLGKNMIMEFFHVVVGHENASCMKLSDFLHEFPDNSRSVFTFIEELPDMAMTDKKVCEAIKPALTSKEKWSIRNTQKGEIKTVG